MSLLDQIKGLLPKEAQENNEKKLAAKVQEQYTLAKHSKEIVKEKWKRFIKLYKGEHWSSNRASWKSRPVRNVSASIVEAMIPLMGDRQPVCTYLPQSDDDVQKAKQLDRVADFVWSTDNLDEKFPELIRDVLIIGTAILKVRWDVEKYNGLGDVSFDLIDVFDFFPDPDATRPEEMEWCIHKTKMSVNKINRLYGKTVPSDGDYYGDDHTRDTDTKEGNKKNSNIATVLEYWHKDEEGNIKVTTVSNGVLLEDKYSPYEVNEFPFIWFYDHKLNGELWGKGEFVDLEPLQIELNKTAAMILDNMIAQNNSILLIDSNSGINPKELRNEPGLVVEKTPGSAVQRLEQGIIPPHFHQHLDSIEQEMEKISGIHEISRGVTSQTAAQGIQMLIEQSQTRIRGKLKNVENGVKKMSKWILVLVRQYYQEPRIIRLVGNNDAFHFQTFDATQLRQQIPKIDPETGQPVTKMDEQGEPLINQETGQPEVEMEEVLTEFDVKVSSGSSMILNKSAKYQQTLELYNAGAVDLETLLLAADIGDPKEIMERLIKDGKRPDPNAPKFDVVEALNQLGIKVSLSATNPDQILEVLTSIKDQVEMPIQQAQDEMLQAQKLSRQTPKQ